MNDEQIFIKELLCEKTQNEAFKKLLSLYKKPLYAQIRNIVLNHDDTDDVLQNTFVKIYQNLKNFKGDSKLFSWMYRIATNEAITFINNKSKNNGFTTQEFQQKQIENIQADLHFDGDEMQLKLLKAVHSLPTKQQLIFKMKYFEDLKYEAMSEILGTSVGGLKASYFHAVKKIEDYLTTN